MRELVIDSFAGGGGASTGIGQALGRSPDIAINHDPIALAMHRMNHPDTRHAEEDVVSVDSVGLCAGRPVGLFWLSPDCKHHSKAKGGKPRDRNIRGLAWTGFSFVKSLPAWQRPRVVILENVEEFAQWGPLLACGRPCPDRRGEIFRQFGAAWEALGYVAEHRELRACDYGAPTIRKRLFWIARRDGHPIIWPTPTHGNPKDPIGAAAIAAGRLKPWRTAAEIIDWSLPCPSIFETSAEIKARFGIRANRPLADATMARIAKGTMRYVVTAAKPFIVQVNHGGGDAGRIHDPDEPAPTMTAGRGEALVTPFASYAQQGGLNRDITEPLHTLTASRKDQNAVVTPFVTKFNSGSTGHSMDEPLATVTAHASETHCGGAAPLGIVAPHLMTMRNAGKPFNGADEPTHTITAGGANLHLVTPFLVPRYGERPGQDPRTRPVDEPAPVIVPTGNEGHLAAVHLSRQFGASVGSGADEPVGTITAGGAGKAAVVTAFLAQHNEGPRPGAPGRMPDEPVSTVTATGGQQSIVAAHMLNLRGSDRRGGPADAPAPTASAQGNHAATVYAFLAKYYGEGLPSQPVTEPLHTITAKPRHGLVTVTIAGEPFVIVDIGMRMLTPRERFNAQGFCPDYIIDRGLLADGSTVPLTLEQQGRMCGNSVSPVMSQALVAANYVPDQNRRDPRRRPEAMPFFLEAAE
ncbi:DNA cytosine methyltransferase [uncultured Enterovirga sp.]|uniref:DNA cytosine methyltransferase n=1 Tax=uncultured Enterovirga sp. TaxID=2026352 RepID=UPI0035CA58B9